MDLETGRSHSAQKKKKKKAIRHNVPRSYQYLTSSCLLLLLLLLRLRLRLCLIILDLSACTPVVFLPCPASQAAILIFLFFLFLSFSLSSVLLFFFFLFTQSHPSFLATLVLPSPLTLAFIFHTFHCKYDQNRKLPSHLGIPCLRCGAAWPEQTSQLFHFIFSLFNRAVAWS